MSSTSDDLKEPILFSIIMPVWNEERYIHESIKSVLNQEYRNLELVIIDDGSTDQTKNICSSFNDVRIHYFYQDNAGLNAARNNGIDKSTGDYLCFLDGDDLLLSLHLSVLLDSIVKKEFPIAIFRTNWISKTGSEQQKIIENHSKILSNPAKYFLLHIPVMHTLCIHRKIFEKCFFDEQLMSWDDKHFMVQATSLFPFYQLKGYTAIYRRNPDKGSSGFLERFDRKFKQEIDYINDLQMYYVKNISLGLSQRDFMKARFITIISFGHGALYHGDINKATYAWKKGIKLITSMYSFLRLLNLGIKILSKKLLNCFNK